MSANTFERVGRWPSLSGEERLATVRDVLEYASDVVQLFPESELVVPIGVAHVMAKALSELYPPATRRAVGGA